MFILGLFVLSAVSGTGKSTVARGLVENGGRWSVSISHTTRAPRGAEIDGVHYHFRSKAVFEEMISSDAFVEWASYLDQYYGTSMQTVAFAIKNDMDLIFDIEINGAKQIKNRFPEAHSVFLLPPSFAVLKERLFGRATDSQEKVFKRLKRGVEELEYARHFDYLVVNDDLTETLAAIAQIRDGGGDRLPRQIDKLNEITRDMKDFLEQASEAEGSL